MSVSRVRLLVSSLLVMSTQGDSCTQELQLIKDDINQLREEIRAEISLKVKKEVDERLNDGKINLTADIIDAIKAELAKAKNNDKLESSVVQLMARVEEVTAENSQLRTKLESQEAKVTNLLQTNLTTSGMSGAPQEATPRPEVVTCAYQDYWTLSSGTITFDSLVSEYYSQGGRRMLDTSSGVFRVVTAPGYYTISYSGWARLEPGQATDIFLHRNGDRIEESRWMSGATGGSKGARQYDQGGRTLILYLGLGDTLELRTHTMTGALYGLTFCLTLSGY